MLFTDSKAMDPKTINPDNRFNNNDLFIIPPFEWKRITLRKSIVICFGKIKKKNGGFYG